MKLIMRADDLGFSDGVNCGILKSVEAGLITNVGLMPNMVEAKSGYEMIKDYHICLGQHTNICVGKPVADPNKIPSLVQENGEFYSSREIRERTEDTIVIEEVEIEIEAQLERFRKITGKDPDYFEGHAIFSEKFFQALSNVAEKNGLFYINPVDKEWSDKYGIECSSFYQLDKNGLYDIEKYIFEDEADILNKQCAVLVFHPGYIDQYLLDNSSYTLIRPMETEFLCSKKFKSYIKQKNIQIVEFNSYR
ncbi:hypothetical protein BAU15_13735 [Enterococcus sp. JM4C]|uniref:ChbG/HpnK family deacetylase n=1 Tax=Candidatus Enterococcus huntleyi TaxID=1857217 RepID=UPI00137B4DA5|nr:ChbG/HpnK family deacetylase [Enterococcus sp. JM4C]KAF1298333.1 hypothetical protein BAU15_13735 [Enterococcus sp. JM4C]